MNRFYFCNDNMHQFQNELNYINFKQIYSNSCNNFLFHQTVANLSHLYAHTIAGLEVNLFLH